MATSPVHLRGAEAVVPNVIKAVEVARTRQIPVVWAVREHDPIGRDVERFRRHLYAADKPKPSCKGSAGAELVDGLIIKDGDYKLVKTRFSAFFNTNLHSYLQACGIRNLVIVGVQTAFDAVSLDYHRVSVIVDASAAASPEIHMANIADMKKVRIAAPTLEEWCNGFNTENEICS